MAANSAPEVAAIADQTLEAGAELDVDVAVSDADGGDSHTLEAATDNACVATVAAGGAGVTVRGRIAGTATVTVSADDGSGAGNSESDPVTFEVTVLPPAVPAWALPRAAPADEDVTPCAVAGVLDHVYTDRAVQSALLLRGGRVIGERYAAGHDIASLGTSWSVAKSIYAAAVGAAIDRGYIASLDQKASDFLTEWIGTDTEDVTVRDMLEMRAGLTDPASYFTQADHTAAALAAEQVREPGTDFEYSNATSQLFEPLLLRSTGQNAHDWLWQSVFEPIGIDRNAIGMWFDPTGVNPMTYCCLDMRPDDFARFGALYADGGAWNGDQVISADYVAESLAAQSPFYGLQWWVLNSAYLGRQPPIDVSAAHGLEGQHIYVWRDAGVVLVVLTQYEHFANQGYVLSFTNYPSTCGARNSCPGALGARVEEYDEDALLDALAELR